MMLYLKFDHEIETKLAPDEVAGRLYYILEDQERYRVLSATEDRIDFDHHHATYHKNNKSLFGLVSSIDMENRMDNGVVIIKTENNNTVIKLRYRINIIFEAIALLLCFVFGFFQGYGFILLMIISLKLFFKIWNVKSMAKYILYHATD